MTKQKEHVSLNGHTKFSCKTPSYSGTLGEAWYRALRDGTDQEAIAEEKKRREKYVDTIKNEKIDTILSHKLTFEKITDNVLHFTGEDDKKTYHYEFVAYPREYADIEKRLGISGAIK